MRLESFTVAATAGGISYSPVYRPNAHISPFNVGFGVVYTTTAKYTIQHTFDDLVQTTADSATWFNHPFVADVSSQNSDGNYAYPVAGIRLRVCAANTGSARVNFIQAGYAGN